MISKTFKQLFDAVENGTVTFTGADKSLREILGIDQISQEWVNDFSERPRVERINDPLGREMYAIDGKKYYASHEKDPMPGDFVVGSTGVIMRVVQVDKETSVMGGIQHNVTARYMDGTGSEKVWEQGSYRTLAKIVEDACPWCGDELSSRHIWKDEKLGKLLWQYYKTCDTCGCQGVSPPGDKDNVTWWNADEMMFDKDTKEILYNPNYIDED